MLHFFLRSAIYALHCLPHSLLPGKYDPNSAKVASDHVPREALPFPTPREGELYSVLASYGNAMPWKVMSSKGICQNFHLLLVF